MRTVPVNHSAGPLADGWEPILLMSIGPILSVRFVRSAAGHLLQLFGVASTLHGYVGGGIVDVTQIVGRECD